MGSLIDDIRDALAAFADPEEDGLIEAWGRRVVFGDASPVWAAVGSENPPRTFALMVRTDDDAWELVWQREPNRSLDACPVVEITTDGDTQVLAPDVRTWLDALLFSRGALGGGSEDELETAREDASREAREVAESVQDELELDTPDPADLGETWEELQDALADLWADAAEGLE